MYRNFLFINPIHTSSPLIFLGEGSGGEESGEEAVNALRTLNPSPAPQAQALVVSN